MDHNNNINTKPVTEIEPSSPTPSTSSSTNSNTNNISSTSKQPSSIESIKPYRVADSPIFGRYLVASRDLKAGETVLKQTPVVIGPCGEPVCLGCYVPTPSRSKQYKYDKQKLYMVYSMSKRQQKT